MSSSHIFPKLNNVVISGELALAPVARQTRTGQQVVNFVVSAFSRQQSWGGVSPSDERLNRIAVVAPPSLADGCLEALARGVAVIVEGELVSIYSRSATRTGSSQLKVLAVRIQTVSADGELVEISASSPAVEDPARSEKPTTEVEAVVSRNALAEDSATESKERPPRAKPPAAKSPVTKPPAAKSPATKSPAAKPPVAKSRTAKPRAAKPRTKKPRPAKPPVAKSATAKSPTVETAKAESSLKVSTAKPKPTAKPKSTAKPKPVTKRRVVSDRPRRTGAGSPARRKRSEVQADEKDKKTLSRSKSGSSVKRKSAKPAETEKPASPFSIVESDSAFDPFLIED